MPGHFSTSAAIEVASGLTLTYLLLSLACTFINEIIATALCFRANALEEAITRIIDVSVLRDDFYNHGLIDAGKIVNHNRHVSYLHGHNFALGLLAALDRDVALPSFENLLVAVKRLPDSNIRDIIFVNMVAADGNIVTLCNNIAHWFEQAMDRVSGLYNRKLKALSLAVGIMLATAVNADTIAISQSLWHDSALREELLASPESISASHKPTAQDILQNEQLLRPLPLGWHSLPLDYPPSYWLFKVAGLLMTDCALSFGAPFWFDLLSRFIRLRGTGIRPIHNYTKSPLAN